MRLGFTLVLATALAGAAPKKPEKPAEPEVTSVYPQGGQRGSTFEAEIRGADLAGARALVFDGAGVEAEVVKAEAERVRVRVHLAAAADAGTRDFRVVTPRGVTNKLSLQVLTETVLEESQAPEVLRQFPVVILGRLEHPGESDGYWVEAAAGETLTFEATGGPKLDPALALYEASGSWFDPQRLNRIAFNDEPLYFPGLAADARLVQRFARGGKYCLKVVGFSGQGSPDSAYRLRITKGVANAPVLHPSAAKSWDERQFTRGLNGARLADLSRRGEPQDSGSVETFHAVPESSAHLPVMTAPGMIVGRIARPGEAHVIRLRVDKPQDLAIEIETPEATLPRFNPVVRLMEPGGREMATNVYTKLNNNGLYMMKMIESKVTVSLRAPGEYRLQIRDITTGCGGEDFLYRVLVRPQIPHIGKIAVEEDHLNLEAGSSRPLNVKIDREEGFGDYVAVAVDGLPAGVTAIPAVENPPDKPPLPNGGKLERYIAREQQVAVMLVAAADAPLTTIPAKVRVAVRVVSKGVLYPPVTVEEIPFMVIARRPS